MNKLIPPNSRELKILQEQIHNPDLKGSEFETFWLSQKMIVELFNVGVATINYHLKEIYQTEELDELATIRKFLIVQTEDNQHLKKLTGNKN